MEHEIVPSVALFWYALIDLKQMTLVETYHAANWNEAADYFDRQYPNRDRDAQRIYVEVQS